ncbi:hypothetical protein B0T17DRAFT_403075 [Bombardia bombarda]|uniref:Uncharacterized protein n=1 Tax=Bombardia bombarda TaxID=252184 RepID=A0AA39WCZ8_9PEZI|nr:hypothetical protein B0T17DRAFT_403075 [Bombardia bombarda]
MGVDIFGRKDGGCVGIKAPEELPPDVFVKRPRLALYDILLKHKSRASPPQGGSGRGRSNGSAGEPTSPKHRWIPWLPCATGLYHWTRVGLIAR